MSSRGRQLVQLALDKLKHQQSSSSAKDTDCYAESFIDPKTSLTCDESLSTDSKSGKEDTDLSDENNNEQDCKNINSKSNIQSTDNEKVLVQAIRNENLDGTYFFATALSGTLSEKDDGHDTDEPCSSLQNDEDEISDEFETYPTEINTVYNSDPCSYKYRDGKTCAKASNVVGSGEHKEPINETAMDKIENSEHESDDAADDMFYEEDLDLDDSVADPDYDPIKDKDKDTESTDTEEPIRDKMQDIPIDHEEIVNTEQHVKRRKRKSLHEWDRNKQKVARMEGKKYKGMKRNAEGKWRMTEDRGKRELKDRGCSKQCNISKVKYCKNISEADRQAIFQQFWKEFTWEEKKVYVTNLIVETDVTKLAKQGVEVHTGRKGKSYKYFLRVGEERYCVCKAMFLNTLGIGEKTAYGWKQAEKKVTADINVVDRNEPSTANAKKAPSDVRAGAHTYLENLPKMESHYCRSTSSKQYLEPVFASKADLYKVYKTYCREHNIPNIASNCLFFNVFEEMNLSLYKPKKDQCDKCCEFQVGNISVDEYNEHIMLKDEARKAKVDDKERAINDSKVKVLTMDLQAVLLCPRLQASALYYKTKLSCHNFTLMNLATKDTTCYVWNETEGDLSASSFASCTTDYLGNLIRQDDNVQEIVIYSDGCNYQNRNIVLSNALLKTAVDNGVTILQKYLERGHTQMEVDSIHSLVERKLKRQPIYVPQNYVDVIASCRPSRPVNVKYVRYSFFKDFKQLNTYSSIRPGSKAGEPTVTNLRVLRYGPDGTIQYKLGFSEEYKDFPRRAKVQNPSVGTVTQLHQNRIPIKASKFKHLQELKSVIPPDYHYFFDSLPHKED